MYGTCISKTFLCQTNSWFFYIQNCELCCGIDSCLVQLYKVYKINLVVDICVPQIVWICSVFKWGTWQRCPVTVLVICKCWTIVFVLGWHGCHLSAWLLFFWHGIEKGRALLEFTKLRMKKVLKCIKNESVFTFPASFSLIHYGPFECWIVLKLCIYF